MSKIARVLTEGNGHQKANRDLALKFLLNYFNGSAQVDESTLQLIDWGVCHIAAYTSSKGAMVSSATASNSEFGSRDWHYRDHILMFRDVGDGRCFLYVCNIRALLEKRKSGTHFVIWETVRNIAKKTLVFSVQEILNTLSAVDEHKLKDEVSSSGKRWTKEETLLALELYCSLRFGQLTKSNKSIIELAEKLDRTPSSVAMKAANFASLDDSLKQNGLKNVSKLDKEIWAQFKSNPTQIILESESYKSSQNVDDTNWLDTLEIPQGESTTEAVVKVRKLQRFFRKAVLQSYDFKCAISGLGVPELLVASHIIPWSVSEEKRADPTNGIALNAIYDKAFDKGYISVDDEYKVIVGSYLKSLHKDTYIKHNFIDLEGQKINVPDRFKPDLKSLAWHRDNLFK